MEKARLHAWLPARLQAAADATLAEHAAAFAEVEGIEVSLTAMSRAIASLPRGPRAELTSSERRRRVERPLKSRNSSP